MKQATRAIRIGLLLFVLLTLSCQTVTGLGRPKATPQVPVLGTPSTTKRAVATPTLTNAVGGGNAGKTKGPAEAKVLVQEFADFQCPYCAKFAASQAHQLLDQYAEAGKIRYEFHHFIVIDGNTGSQESRRAAEASECANQQGQFWRYANYLFTHQNGEGKGAFSDANLKAFAVALELNQTSFNACFDGRTTVAAVRQVEALGNSLGVGGTPTVYVNGKSVSNPLDATELQKAIDAALAP